MSLSRIQHKLLQKKNQEYHQSVKQSGSRSDILYALNWVHILFAFLVISIDERKFESTSYRVGIA